MKAYQVEGKRQMRGLNVQVRALVHLVDCNAICVGHLVKLVDATDAAVGKHLSWRTPRRHKKLRLPATHDNEGVIAHHRSRLEAAVTCLFVCCHGSGQTNTRGAAASG